MSLSGGNPVNEALEMAKKIAAEGIRSLVIDTEKDFIKFGFAAKLAYSMNSYNYKGYSEKARLNDKLNSEGSPGKRVHFQGF